MSRNGLLRVLCAVGTMTICFTANIEATRLGRTGLRFLKPSTALLKPAQCLIVPTFSNSPCQKFHSATVIEKSLTQCLNLTEAYNLSRQNPRFKGLHLKIISYSYGNNANQKLIELVLKVLEGNGKVDIVVGDHMVKKSSKTLRELPKYFEKDGKTISFPELLKILQDKGANIFVHMPNVYVGAIMHAKIFSCNSPVARMLHVASNNCTASGLPIFNTPGNHEAGLLLFHATAKPSLALTKPAAGQSSYESNFFATLRLYQKHIQDLTNGKCCSCQSPDGKKHRCAMIPLDQAWPHNSAT